MALKYFSESLWRDEAFSWAMASRGLDAIPLTARDFNPPLYYLLLYLWMQLAGSSEMAMRSLSVVFFLATLWVAWRFMIDLLAIPARRAAAYLVLFALNPVLTYYAVEARMYSQLAFLAAASFYSYQARRPALYILSTTAGLYTHYFMLLVVAVQVLATLMTMRETPRWRQRALVLLTPVLLLVPWLLVVVAVREGDASEFWIAPLNWRFGLHLLTAIYTGHDAVYGFLGRFDRWLFALCLLSLVAWSLRAVSRSAAERRPGFLLVALWALAPPLVVFAISFLQPVFLPRYLLFASLGLLLLLACGLEATTPRVRFALLVVLSALAIRYQLLQAHHHSKGEYRNTIRAIASQAQPADLLYVRNELDFFPAQYYFGQERVFLYGRSYEEIPAFVGRVLIPRHRLVSTRPAPPARVFVLQNDREFVGW